jgi:hypothetical protein
MAELGNFLDDNVQVNRLFLYAALEKVQIMREFAFDNYCHHTK